MELKEFIEKTFENILDGIENSQRYAKTKNAQVGINKVKTGTCGVNNNSWDKYSALTNTVSFEVILTDFTNNSNGIGIGVSFGVFEAGYNNKKGGEITSCTKVCFTVPITFPEQ